MTLDGQVGSLYQTKASGSAQSRSSEDLRTDPSGKPFGVSYMKMPEELPQDWYSSMETGTTVGSDTQKDD